MSHSKSPSQHDKQRRQQQQGGGAGGDHRQQQQQQENSKNPRQPGQDPDMLEEPTGDDVETGRHVRRPKVDDGNR